MSNPESTLQQRLADIVGASADPFAKVASADPQLDAIAEATFEQAEETAEVTEEQPVEATTEEQPVEAVAKEASVADLSVREIVASDAFQAGFRDTYAQHAGEIEYAIAKLAEANKDNFRAAFFGVHDHKAGSPEERAAIMKATPASKRKAVAKALDAPTGKPTLRQRLGAGARGAAAGGIIGTAVGAPQGAMLGALGSRRGSRLKDTARGAGTGALVGAGIGGALVGGMGLKEGGRQMQRYNRAAEAAGYGSQKKEAEVSKEKFDNAYWGGDDSRTKEEAHANMLKATPAGKRKAVKKVLDAPDAKPTLKQRLGMGARLGAAGAMIGGTMGAGYGALGARTRPGRRLKDTARGAGKGALVGAGIGAAGLGALGLKDGGRDKRRYEAAAEAAGYGSQKKEAGYGKSMGYGAGIGAGLNVARTAMQNRGKSEEEKKSLLRAAARGGAAGAGAGAGVQAMKNRRGRPMRIAPGTTPMQIEAPKG